MELLSQFIDSVRYNETNMKRDALRVAVTDITIFDEGIDKKRKWKSITN